MSNLIVPDEIKQAARRNNGSEPVTVLKSWYNKKTGETTYTEIQITAKNAMNILSTPVDKRSPLAKRIRAVGTVSETAKPIADPTLLTDEALQIEFEKRFGKTDPAKELSPVEELSPLPAPGSETEEKRGPGRPKKEVTDEPSLLTNESDSQDA